jgi:hypothetical protein
MNIDILKVSSVCSRVIKSVLCAAIALTITVGARAASPYTETFSSPDSGWQNGNTQRVDGMTVTREDVGGNPGGVLRMRWAPIVIPLGSTPPVIAPDALVATGHLASAHFTGDLEQAGAWLIGLDVNAVQTLPDYMYLAIHSGTSMITRTLMKARDTTLASNTWHSFRYTLLNPPENLWGQDSGEVGEVIREVTALSLVIKRRGEGLEDYLIDNIFIHRIPEASANMTITAGTPGEQANGVMRMSWDHLQPGAFYRIEATKQLDRADGWKLVQRFQAQEPAFTMDLTGVTENQKYYRIILE